MWGKQRAGTLSVTGVDQLNTAFELDWHGSQTHLRRFTIVDVVPELFASAARIAGRRGLRAYDAVQLASAEAARAADPGCDTFACFDASLRDAAARSGFALYPRG